MIKELEKIKSLEEYEIAKKDFEKYMGEYKWISESENPKEEVENKLKECMQQLHFGMEKQDEIEMLSKIHTLKTKYISIARGEYQNQLRQNITGLMMMLEQFEANEKHMPFGEVVKGIFTNDEKTKEYLKNKYMLSLSNMYGVVPAPERLDLERMPDILEYMYQNYDLVTIDLSNDEEKGLAIIPEPVVGMKKQIEEYALNKSNVLLTQIDTNQIKENIKEEKINTKPKLNKEYTKTHVKEKDEAGEIDR